MTKIRYTIRLVLLQLVVALAVILVIEAAGRVVIRLKYGVPGKSYGCWRYDRELGSVQRPNSYNSHSTTNDWGFRNHEDVFDPKPENGLRILALGGSTTYGYNLPDTETFPYKLERTLRSVPGYERSQVFNAGHVACGATYNLVIMRRLVPRLMPDYVILYEGVNELLTARFLSRAGYDFDELAGRFDVVPRNKDQDRWLKRNSIIVRFIDYKIRQMDVIDPTAPRPKDSDASDLAVHPWVVENYTWTLQRMIDFLQDQGVIPIVVRFASVGAKHHRLFSDLTAEIGRTRGVPVYDMQAAFESNETPMEEMFISSGVHTVSAGTDILATGLARMILDDVEDRAAVAP